MFFECLICRPTDRPGRSEARVQKRRPKAYLLITKPRHQWEQAIVNCLTTSVSAFISAIQCENTLVRHGGNRATI
ncbi:hypothetical protein [Nostoc sp.]|uniref:hypothetical protein n=1 Tax=Nostoc sp. TaxID=1180 RepID=UPI002FFCA4B5